MKRSSDITGAYIDFLSDESRRMGCADAILFAESEADIRQVLHEAAAAGIPVTTQSGLTGITGGATPDGGWILNVSRMTRVLGMRFDAAQHRYIVRVQPGLTLKALNEALMHGADFDTTDWDDESKSVLNRYRQDRPHVFAPDLTEAGACLAGVVANNGSGARSFRYGPARPHVQALRVVLMGGDVLPLARGDIVADGYAFSVAVSKDHRIRGCIPNYTMPAVKHAAGLYATKNMDLLDLFVGSEGVLGTFAELALTLTPVPVAAWGLTAFLPDETSALVFVEKVRRMPGKRVAAIEFFSAQALELLRRQRHDNPAFAALPLLEPHWHSAVYVELHGDSEVGVEDAMSVVCDYLTACGGDADESWLATGQREIDSFKGVRHAVPEAVNLLIGERKREFPALTKLGTDLAVPDDHLCTVMRMYHQDLAEQALEYVIFGHIGNNHLHVNILPRNPEEYSRGKMLYLEWARRVVEMGGTVSAEHGIGKLKTNMLEIMYGAAAIEQMRAVKQVFDPQMLLNRGTLFTPSEMEM